LAVGGNGQTNIGLMKILTTLLLSAIVFDSLGQLTNETVEKKLQIPDLKNSKSEIEIRLFSNASLSPVDSYVWIKKVNGTWSATSYKFVDYSENNFFELKQIYNDKLKKNWDVQIQNLLTRDFSNYLDQSQLRDKLIEDYKSNNGDDSYFMVTDGTGYTLTIKIGEKVRSFYLHSPSAYSTFFQKFPELKWYSDILDVIDKNVKVKLK
jgi:hypothetical protein